MEIRERGSKGRRGKFNREIEREMVRSRNVAAREKFGNEVTLNSVAGLETESSMLFDNLTWLSTKDAAIYLRKFKKRDGKPSDGAIRTAIWRKLLKARKWGRRLYIKRSDLDRLLELSLI